MIREFIRHTPLIEVWRNYQKKKEYNQIMSWNEEYRKTIEPLFDIPFLKRKIQELYTSKNNRTVYVINQENTKVGIYGYINCFLPHIAYAIAKGYIPVIDMQTRKNIYLSTEEYSKGGVNAWEKFYEQPMNIGLNDLDEKTVIYCPSRLWYRWMPNSCPLMSDQEIEMWSTIYREFVRYNKESQAYVDSEFNSILGAYKNVLGIIYRGTTYTKGHAVGHPVQPSMEMLGNKVEEMLTKKDIDKIYLASDEKSIVDYMNQRFPGSVLINKRVYYDEVEGVDYSKYNIDGTDIVGDMFDRPNNEYWIGMEYISSMNLVANCYYLVAGSCGGTTAVLYMNGLQFKEKYIFDLGKYGREKLTGG